MALLPMIHQGIPEFGNLFGIDTALMFLSHARAQSSTKIFETDALSLRSRLKDGRNAYSQSNLFLDLATATVRRTMGMTTGIQHVSNCLAPNADFRGKLIGRWPSS